MGFLIRLCTAADIADVQRVWTAGLSQTYERFQGEQRQQWKDAFDKEAATAVRGDLADPVAYWVRRGLGAFFVALDRAGSVVGCVGVKAGETLVWVSEDTSCNTASVWRLSVDASVRRQGLATLLMKAVEAWAAANGFQRVRMMTANCIASTFYEGLGYAVIVTDGLCRIHCKELAGSEFGAPLLAVPAIS